MIETEAMPSTSGRTARSPTLRGARRCPSIAIMLIAFAAGCGDTKDPPPDGLYIYCDGKADGLHYTHGISGRVIDHFSLPCLGPEFVSETGDTGSGEIDLGEWTNDTEDIDSLRNA
jgi:hypothetical protein